MKKKKRRNSQKQPLNRNRKDRLFRLAFQDRKDLLELYNAINRTSYDDPGQLEITTLTDAVFLGVKNDLSFIIATSMNLYEHQSTMCGNMPLRGLIYFSSLYQAYIKRHGYNLYCSSTICLPFPNYLIFYNGGTDEPDESEMLLSEAFQKPDKDVPPAVECRVKMLNINRGHNSELIKGCRRLLEYAEFIGYIQDNISNGLTVREAVNKAMDTCQKLGILSDLLGRCRTEVLNMLLAVKPYVWWLIAVSIVVIIFTILIRSNFNTFIPRISHIRLICLFNPCFKIMLNLLLPSNFTSHGIVVLSNSLIYIGASILFTNVLSKSLSTSTIYSFSCPLTERSNLSINSPSFVIKSKPCESLSNLPMG